MKVLVDTCMWIAHFRSSNFLLDGGPLRSALVRRTTGAFWQGFVLAPSASAATARLALAATRQQR